MTEENDTTIAEETPQVEAQAETPPLPEGMPDPMPQWEYRKDFKVVDRMKEIVNLTMDVTKHEIKHLRRKIDKLTYGS